MCDGMLPTQRARVGELFSSSLAESAMSPAADSASDSTSLVPAKLEALELLNEYC